MFELRIHKRLPGFELNVDLVHGDGEITALFGPSGAGKSLTLQCTAGLVRPDAGRIVLCGDVAFDVAAGIDRPPQARRVGYVFQDYALFPHLTVAQNVAYGLGRQPRSEARTIIDSMLTLVRLENLASRWPRELSGGQQQRVALARALATRPRLLLLDEPFSALDEPTRVELRRDLRALQRQLRIPTLLVTHDLAEAYTLADRIAVMAAGRILQVGTPEEVVYRPATREVARVTGGTNLFLGWVMSCGEDGGIIQVGDVRLDTLPYRQPPGASVEISIRPERIMLLRPDRPPGLRDNELLGHIVDETASGLTHTLFFRLDGPRLRDGAYDLEIDLTAYVYERLDIVAERQWLISIKRSAIHVMRVMDENHPPHPTPN